MLEITPNTISSRIDSARFKSLRMLPQPSFKTTRRVLLTCLSLVVIVLFLPWTQNIRSKGVVTALSPEQRPQEVQTIIGGRIEKWFVQEGQFVHRGDTILYISETKDTYFNPNLLENIDAQISSKESSVLSYMDKVKALDAQIDAMLENKKVKLEQGRNKISQIKFKIKTDSLDAQNAGANYRIAQDQMARYDELLNKGLISKTEHEQRKTSMQNAQTKSLESQNKFEISKSELNVATNELRSINNDYNDKIAKAESEKYASMSSMFDSEAEVSKLQNTQAGVRTRNGYYFITAPQDGYITKATQSGVGESIKEGESVVSILPANFQLAVEMHVSATDMPLIAKGQHVQFIFDGWPAFVFGGWPDHSTGTFSGKVAVIDRFASTAGKYRILVVPDSTIKAWPSNLRIGTGAEGIALLNDVPIYYELWRQINGFPPEYYQDGTKAAENKNTY